MLLLVACYYETNDTLHLAASEMIRYYIANHYIRS